MPKFSVIKRQLIECLINGHVVHELRSNIGFKNLLHVSQVSIDDVCNMMKQAKGNEFISSPHHTISGVTVHIVKNRYASKQWYIKWYFIEPNAVFISVHN